MKKGILLSVIIYILMISVNVWAGEDLVNFKANQTKIVCSGYECSVEINAESAEITYEKGDNVAKISPESGHKITFNNEHSIQYEVVYQDGKVANYTLTVKKHVKSGDNTLKKLVINDEEIELKKDVFVYSYNALFNDEIIKVIGTTNDELASCDEKEYEFDLESSSLKIEYPVTAENGDVKKYAIILKRKAKPDTTLKALSLSNIDIEYKKEILDYEVNIPYSIDTTTIKAIANDSLAKVEIAMDEFFVVGENFIEIKVTNQEASDTYVIKVNRLERVDETIGNLEKLIVNNYKLDFKSDIYNYDLVFKQIPKKLNLSYQADSKAKVKVENNENLEDGSCVLIKVILDDGVFKTYKLNILLDEKEEYNKVLLIVLIILLVITMIVLFILQYKENVKKKHKRNKKKKIKEEEIEVI